MPLLRVYRSNLTLKITSRSHCNHPSLMSEPHLEVSTYYLFDHQYVEYFCLMNKFETKTQELVGKTCLTTSAIQILRGQEGKKSRCPIGISENGVK